MSVLRPRATTRQRQEAGAGAWSHRDVGSVGAAGNASVTASAGAVTGSGADIWGTSDAFHYAYTSVSGDFSITARVTSLDNVHAWTKAGLMIRASTAAGSAHVSLFATPGAVNGIAMQRRASAGASSVHTAGAGVAPVVWLR